MNENGEGKGSDRRNESRSLSLFLPSRDYCAHDSRWSALAARTSHLTVQNTRTPQEGRKYLTSTRLACQKHALTSGNSKGLLVEAGHKAFPAAVAVAGQWLVPLLLGDPGILEGRITSSIYSNMQALASRPRMTETQLSIGTAQQRLSTFSTLQ